MTLTWVPREQNGLVDALTNRDFGNFRKENRMEVDAGSLGFKFFLQMVRVAESLCADPVARTCERTSIGSFKKC